MLLSLLKSAFRRSASRAAPDPALVAAAPAAAIRERFVAFVTTGDKLHRFDPADRLRSSQASMRLRVQIPGRELSRVLPVHAIPLEYLLQHPDLGELGEPAAIVVGKISTDRVMTREQEIRALLAWLKARSGTLRLVADLSDDYAGMAADLKSPFLVEYQQALGRHCVLTVPCEAMRAQVAPQAQRGVHVIEDPWESPRANAPRAKPAGVPRLAWFGYLAKTNIQHLERSLADIAVRFRGRALHLDFLAQGVHEPLAAALLGRLTELNPQLDASFISWSPEAAWQAIDNCDFVLLPQDTQRGWSAVKSHNRMVEAIRGGRLAIASPIPSYRELADYAWVGEDLGEGLEWALANPEEAQRRIAAGQAHIVPRFAPEAVGAKWARLLEVQGSQTAVRLNLGCGDKILPGYVNVDVAPSRNGRRPDVLCDLRKLASFGNSSAEEVMAIHVVEHFWRWEVVEVLREWVRVLRPGGRMVLECPNLASACREVLEGPPQAVGPGQEGQRSMWVLYGDPRWQDPLMVHRWGYTPQSLAQVMQEAGLVNVRQEPAQFKMREPRDMRVVGEKPAA